MKTTADVWVIFLMIAQICAFFSALVAWIDGKSRRLLISTAASIGIMFVMMLTSLIAWTLG